MIGLALCVLVLSFGLGDAVDPKVTIRQTYPYTEIRDNYKTLVVEKDKDTFIACVVDNLPLDKKVQWLSQNFNTDTNIPISTDTDAQNSVKYQIDKPADNNWRLKIQNTQTTDEALYICRVQLGGQQNANDSRIIKVVQKPQIIDIYTSSDTESEEGSRVELACDASGIPPPRISWQMVGGGTLPTGGREFRSKNMVIESARADHKGDFLCIAENESGRDVRRIYLNIKFKPRVQPDSPIVYQALNYDKELKCEVYGNPVPLDSQVIWYRDGIPLDNSGRYVFKNYFGSNYVLMKMRINSIEAGDYGTFKCFAENIEGGGESFVTLAQTNTPTSVDGEPAAGATNLMSFSLTTLIMIVATLLLHTC